MKSQIHKYVSNIIEEHETNSAPLIVTESAIKNIDKIIRKTELSKQDDIIFDFIHKIYNSEIMENKFLIIQLFPSICTTFLRNFTDQQEMQHLIDCIKNLFNSIIKNNQNKHKKLSINETNFTPAHYSEIESLIPSNKFLVVKLLTETFIEIIPDAPQSVVSKFTSSVEWLCTRGYSEQSLDLLRIELNSDLMMAWLSGLLLVVGRNMGEKAASALKCIKFRARLSGYSNVMVLAEGIGNVHGICGEDATFDKIMYHFEVEDKPVNFLFH